MNHTCQDRGGSCAGCAAEAIQDKIEDAATRHEERLAEQIGQIAAELDCSEDAVREHLWPLISAQTEKEWG